MVKSGSKDDRVYSRGNINMKTILSIYPNCSLGGMTSVYLGRMMSEKDVKFDFLFVNDKGGKDAFDTVDYRIIRKDRLRSYFDYTIKNSNYSEIRITSLPELTHYIPEAFSGAKIIYEFHTSSLDVIEREVNNLKITTISEIWVPSLYLKNIIQGFIRKDININVVPNIVNIEVFDPQKTVQDIFFPKNSRPIFWVGRLDKGKNYKDFFRMLSLLPEEYEGYLILSFENEASRISEALLETEMYRINHRVHFLLNLTQSELADLYVNSYESKGIYCSTSLAESFGYGVLEAALAGLPVVTYEVGGISGHAIYDLAMHMVSVGDTEALARKVEEIQWDTDHQKNLKSRYNYLTTLNLL